MISSATPATTTRGPIVEIENLTKAYVMGHTEVHALRGVSLTIHEGEYVAIVGASGSGKSTLMNMIGLLDRPTDGSYRVRGVESSQLSKNRLADLRNREIGFVFQRFNLLARVTARRQVELPLFYAGVPSARAGQMAVESLQRVGLGDRIYHKPDELSGGQQQRVAIARALVNRPSLLLADEPTGALDSHTGQEILALFDDLHRQGMTLVVVTHDAGVAQRAERMITLSDGLIVQDRRNGVDAVAQPQPGNGHAGHTFIGASVEESPPPAGAQPTVTSTVMTAAEQGASRAAGIEATHEIA
jgi:putative ABC transport system ATP-binding protein